MVAAMHATRDDAHAGNGAGGKGGCKRARQVRVGAMSCMIAAMHATRNDAHAGNRAGGKGGRKRARQVRGGASAVHGCCNACDA